MTRRTRNPRKPTTSRKPKLSLPEKVKDLRADIVAERDAYLKSIMGDNFPGTSLVRDRLNELEEADNCASDLESAVS